MFKFVQHTVFGLLFIPFCSCQQEKDSISAVPKNSFEWKHLYDGLDFCETDAPFKSIVNDSKITLLKIDPEKFDFEMLIATEIDKKSRTVKEWADSFKLDIVINAGMYELSKKLISRGYLSNYQHKNNAQLHPTFNSVIAFNPTDSLKPVFDVMDLQCENWGNITKSYHSLAQGLRMIDCNGAAIGWNKRKQSCSMLAAGMDDAHQLYLIYCRSPYTHNEMISFMLDFPFKLSNVIYLEGGPQTSLYVNLGDTKMEKVGSYVSETYPNDLNDHFWTLPNVIGLRYKK